MRRPSVLPDDASARGSASGTRQPGLGPVVAALRQSREGIHNIRSGRLIRRMPARGTLEDIAEQIVMALFPTHHGSHEASEDRVDGFVAGILGHALNSLKEQIRFDLAVTTDQDGTIVAERAQSIVHTFAERLPEIRAALVSDLLAAYEGDPAATGYPEILLGYPGMIATIYHRLAHPLFRLGATLSARLIASVAHSKTAIDIHPGAEIGPQFFIDHGTGVVIGETAVIGRRVRIYQAVTLGARNFPTDEAGAIVKGAPRHPIVEDDVVIYAGATILGRITIGRGSVIGGNVWLTESVPPDSHISQAKLRSD